MLKKNVVSHHVLALFLFPLCTLVYPGISNGDSVSGTNERLKNIESSLSILNYNPGTVDGIPDPATLTAIRQFQQDNHLPIMDITNDYRSEASVKFQNALVRRLVEHPAKNPTPPPEKVNDVTGLVNNVFPKNSILLQRYKTKDMFILQFAFDRDAKRNSPRGRIYAHFLKNGIARGKADPFIFGRWWVENVSSKKHLCWSRKKYRSCYTAIKTPQGHRLERQFYSESVGQGKYAGWNKSPLNQNYGWYTNTYSIEELNLASLYQKYQTLLNIAEAFSKMPKGGNNNSQQSPLTCDSSHYAFNGRCEPIRNFGRRP